MSDAAGRALFRTALASGDFSFLTPEEAKLLAKKLNDWIQCNHPAETDILIPNKIRTDLREKLSDVMKHSCITGHHMCEFCGRHAFAHDVDHREDCVGSQLQKILY